MQASLGRKLSALLVTGLCAGLTGCASTAASAEAVELSVRGPAGRSSAPAETMPLALDSLLAGAPVAPVAQAQGRRRPPPPRSRSGERWPVGATVMQGYLGAGYLEKVEVGSGGSTDLEFDDDDIKNFPVIGGGAQTKLAGEHLDFGLEAMIAFSWRANATAFAVGGGGAALAVDIDLLIVELYGGPFVNMFLGDRTRVYAGAGPLLQFSDLNGDKVGPLATDGNGFGVGGYVRGGIEFSLRPGTMIGIGARWLDASVDLSGGLGDLDLTGTQALFTVTTGL